MSVPTRVLTVVSARPQLVKAAMVSSALRAAGLDEVIVHTGQHYDAAMSAVFFEEMGIPREDANLGVGPGSHAELTARTLERIEPVIVERSPAAVVVFGDTDSTLAAALAAAKLDVPVAHVEAGSRSGDRSMPEEVNRVVTDHVATLHYCSTDRAAQNLADEGVTEGVVVVGDVMADAVMTYGAADRSPFPPARLRGLGLKAGGYVVLTCHRKGNVDDPRRLEAVVQAAGEVAAELPVVFPVHPRTRKGLEAIDLPAPPGLHLCEPLSYLEMIALVREAGAVATDSGGLQKEAYLLRRPCVTLRDTTEWLETVEAGWNELAWRSADAIVGALRRALRRGRPPWRADLYGDGRAAERIARHLSGELGRR